MAINITLNDQPDCLVVNLDGDFDNAASKQAEISLAPVFERTDCDVAIECEKLNYISSCGLRILLNIYKHTHTNGHSAILRHLSLDVEEVFNLSGFLQLFKTDK